MRYKNKINNLRLYCITYIILIFLSIIFGYLIKNRVYQIEEFKLYNINEDKITSDISFVGAKQLNEANSRFKSSIGDIHINIYPVSAQDHFYRMNISSKNILSEQDIKGINEEYTKYIKNDVKEISLVSFKAISKDAIASKAVDIIKNIFNVSIVFFSFCYLISKLDMNKCKKYANEKVLNVIGGILAILTILIGYSITLSIMLIVLGLFFKYKKENNKFLAITFLSAFVIRIVTLVGMVIVSKVKSGIGMSYFQPDEIFYYWTGNQIYTSLAKGIWPNLAAIVENNQYGYNLFMGLVELFNKEIFFTAKLINCLVSSMLIPLTYRCTIRLFNDKRVAKVTTLILVVVPTFILFSTYALRDMFITILILLIFYEVIEVMETKRNIFSTVFKVCIFSIMLVTLRIYAAIMITAIWILYLILRFFEKREKNIIIIFLISLLLLIPVEKLASHFYGFNIFNTFVSYFTNLGVIKYFTGLICSLVNLDFLTNIGGAVYSGKTIIIRMFYPDTVLLVLSAPLFVMGIVAAYKKNKSATIVLILLAIGFITVYKFQYGGWFLRTQLQIFVFQYMFIALGFSKFIGNKHLTGKFKFLE
ncbi:hypothetical protein [Inconstantimicrobium mannanitabidum]|uniref:Uncharacterized protein n=1 Tax=Inconstantimicrobium mannanitabidum TaxID=1604901 RepID=A0ACB5RG46_9CLOT|nr:hypothetical protein [Clostridium sp. TW13]GKX68068.1 hypothetical protein rsdtw13_33260 [Clostridium sp. TW13]